MCYLKLSKYGGEIQSHQNTANTLCWSTLPPTVLLPPHPTHLLTRHNPACSPVWHTTPLAKIQTNPHRRVLTNLDSDWLTNIPAHQELDMGPSVQPRLSVRENPQPWRFLAGSSSRSKSYFLLPDFMLKSKRNTLPSDIYPVTVNSVSETQCHPPAGPFSRTSLTEPRTTPAARHNRRICV